MLDFSGESEQKTVVYGPVPAGSIVMVQMSIRDPGDKKAPDDPLIQVAQTGLRQIYCQFDVIKGQYMGVSWRQAITLPSAMQKIQLDNNRQLACRVGGATLKAILQAAHIGEKIQTLGSFNMIQFPVKVKINKKPYEKDGKYYWRNEIATVITPDMAQFQEANQKGEIINPNGAVEAPVTQQSGNSASYSGNSSQGYERNYMEELQNTQYSPPANDGWSNAGDFVPF